MEFFEGRGIYTIHKTYGHKLWFNERLETFQEDVYLPFHTKDEARAELEHAIHVFNFMSLYIEGFEYPKTYLNEKKNTTEIKDDAIVIKKKKRLTKDDKFIDGVETVIKIQSKSLQKKVEKLKKRLEELK